MWFLQKHLTKNQGLQRLFEGMSYTLRNRCLQLALTKATSTTPLGA